MNTFKNIKIILGLLMLTTSLIAQQTPALKQVKSVLIMNAVAHIGNGQVIENSAIGFRNGKITMVADARVIRLAANAYDTIIYAGGKHVYPGFISPNSTLGLVEIDAVNASDDKGELGDLKPHIRSIIAYNAESQVVESVRPNGILIAQITPRGGRISGTSSIVQLDAWNWKDAVIKEDDGIHLNWPATFSRGGFRSEIRTLEPNKDYAKQTEEVVTFFNDSKTYLKGKQAEKNVVFESMNGLFDGKKTLFIHTNEEKSIIDAVQFAKSQGVPKMVIVGGYEAYKVADLLKDNKVAVLLRRVHDLPVMANDDVDLPYKLAKLLTDKGVLVGLENSGGMERMNTRNLPFYAGTTAAYGLTKEQALSLITFNTAKILGIDQFCGTLEEGKDATLFISEGDALDMRTNQLTFAFIQGRKISLETYQTQLFKRYTEKYKNQ
ncbi:MAG: amidohydrolase family protein [Flavobacteriaceae bacterium]|nr:amidohydrolase family protein [Flavobacteriaceae bacterium]